MTVDVELWNKSFSGLDPKALPNWPCPRCGRTSVILDSNTLSYKQNKEQYYPDEFRNEYFETKSWLGIFVGIATVIEKMQWAQHKFIGFLICENCGETIAFSGRAEIPREKPNHSTYLSIRLYPEYFSPPLPFFSLDSRYPISIRQNFTRSFSFVFNDPASAANAIRQGIESILDELNISRGEQEKRRLSLYERIQKFGENNNEYAELLDGIRFLGNEGSHFGKVSRADVVAAFEIIDHVLDEIFVRSEVRKKVMENSRGLAKVYQTKTKKQ